MISIGGIALVPQPSINITPEYFYFGQEIIGGYLTLELNGVHHASGLANYSGVSSGILSLIDTCVAINISTDCLSSTLTDISGTQGVVKEAKISPAGNALDLNYTISIECSKNKQKIPLIQNTSSIPFAQYLGNKTIVKSYSETVTADFSNMSKFSINNNNNLVKNHGKMNVELDISLYNNDQCDTNTIDFHKAINDFFTGRISELISNPGLLKIQIDNSQFRLYGLNAKKTMRKTGGSINFELYIVPGVQSKAIVDISQTEEVNQITGFANVKIKGSIVGIDSSKDFLSPSYDGMINATSTYNLLQSYVYYANTGNILTTTCGSATITPPASTPGGPNPSPDNSRPSGTCYKLINSRLSEFPTSNKIDFEMTYQDVERCELLGYKLMTEYEERPAVSGRAEHFAPGRPANYYPLTYYSQSTSAPRYKLTVKGEMPSTCLQQSVGHGSIPTGVGEFLEKSFNTTTINTVKSAVSGELATQKNKWTLNTSDNIMTISRSEQEGRYTFSITEEYIKCQ
jgi:hypothetical protein